MINCLIKELIEAKAEQKLIMYLIGGAAWMSAHQKATHWQTDRSSHQRSTIQKDVFQIFCKTHRKTSVPESLF